MAGYLPQLMQRVCPEKGGVELMRLHKGALVQLGCAIEVAFGARKVAQPYYLDCLALNRLHIMILRQTLLQIAASRWVVACNIGDQPQITDQRWPNKLVAQPTKHRQGLLE